MKQSGNLEGIELDVFMANEEKHEHSHFDVELLYSMDDHVIVIVENMNYKMNKEDILVINSGKKHSVHRQIGSRKDTLVCCIHISQKLLSEYTGQYRLVFWCNSVKDNVQGPYIEMRRVLNNLLVDYASGKQERYFYRYSQYYEMLHLLLTYFLVSKDDFRLAGYHEQEDTRHEEIVQFIEMNYNRDLSLGELAEEFHLSVSYLSKYLKKNLGKNFIDYLYSVRMRYALEELLQTENPVTRVALDNGFPNVGVFNRQFRELYHCTPSEYRKNMKNEVLQRPVSSQKQREKELIKEHLGMTMKSRTPEVQSEVLRIHADIRCSESFKTVWNHAVNLGDAASLQYASTREAILYTKKYLKIEYVRIWNLFSEEMNIIRGGRWSTNGFTRLNQNLAFLVENGMKPILELGEKPQRILLSPNEFVQPAKNVSNFKSYDQFQECLSALMKNLISYFGREEIENWLVEIWEDKRVEVYEDKVPYIQLFQDCRNTIKQYAPEMKVGGSGNYLGWYQEHTEESVRKWIDGGVYPDYLTYTYFPYAAGDCYQERFSKRKADESDLLHSVEGLQQLLLNCGFPKKKLFITEWNMSISSRNYFNDSLWKGCYILKCNLETLGKVDALVYSQLVDSTTDYVDTQLLINGSGGLLTRDLIEKPAFSAMKMLAKLKSRLVDRGDGYIVTVDEHKEIAILLYNFINRNYLYYIKGEGDNTVHDHYQYLESQNSKKVEIVLEHLPDEMQYTIRQYIVNRESGSIMDEWLKLSCIENPQPEDIRYLKNICIPRNMLEYRKTENGSLKLEYYLQPLEMRLVTLKLS